RSIRSPDRSLRSPGRSVRSPGRTVRSPGRTVLSPRHSHSRLTETRESYIAPLKTESKDLDYSLYLSESRRRSSRGRRVDEVYETPRRSVERLEDSKVQSSRRRSPLRN